MKENLIEIIRSVPITDKTYAEYVEAVAERLGAEIYFPPYMRFEAKATSVTLNVKYVEDENARRDKQIEEMAKLIHDAENNLCHHKSCRECEYGIKDNKLCKEKVTAEYLLDNGYRKASEVTEDGGIV